MDGMWFLNEISRLRSEKYPFSITHSSLFGGQYQISLGDFHFYFDNFDQENMMRALVNLTARIGVKEGWIEANPETPKC